MKHERILGILILSDVVLGVLGIVSEFALEPFLPLSLRADAPAGGPAAFRARFRSLSEAAGPPMQRAA